MPFFISAGVIALAEMADKTQLLSMCFVSRYGPGKVMLGVLLGTVLNQGLAVAAGHFLREMLSTYIDAVQIVAALSFIAFGIWAFRTNGEEEKCNEKSSLGPVITVATAFFIAEMGDKTQLAAISLAAGFSSPVLVLMGTTTGMLIANGLGVFFGTIINKKMHKKTMQLISGVVFIAFGIVGYCSSVRKFMNLNNVILTSVFILVVTLLTLLLMLRKKSKRKTKAH